MNISGLSNTVAAVLSLSIHGGVPVTIVEDHCISPRQIYSHTTTPGGQDETEDSTVCIKTFHQGLRGTECQSNPSEPK